MGKCLFFVLFLFASCFSGFSQTSQTRTANYWYNIGTDRYVQWGAQYVADDDNSYAYTTRINKLERIYLIVQDFGFTIPADAVIENITARVRRFKSGLGQVKDCFVHLLTANNFDGWSPFGVEMAHVSDPWPQVETVAIYSQGGSGTDGIANLETHTTQPYQWTPALINNSAFGLYLLTNFPDKGFYYAYFDKVEITVEYSLPAVTSRRSPGATETKPLKESLVYPNPFTSKTNIQFTAAESGMAVVELYDINGAKVRTLFSGSVVQGQVYDVPVGEIQLRKGIFIYRIKNGKQKQSGPIIRLE
jgi:hypothetical protein